MTDIGKQFHKETGYLRGKIPLVKLDRTHEPERYKVYPGVTRIKLPTPLRRGGAPLWDVLKKRRSSRKYSAKPLTLQQISQMLWAVQGITEHTHELRTTPSAGALYPIDTYLVVNNVEEMEPGIYHYAVKTHELEVLEKGDKRDPICKSALDQGMANNAPVVFVWSAVFGRSVWKYKERGYRYVYMDAGHVGQSMVTAAAAMRLASCLIGALYDDEANELLGLDGEEESVLYMCSVGHPK